MLLTATCIVEGDGESEAVPLLLRRLAWEIDPQVTLRFRHPIRVPRSKLVHPQSQDLERYVELAARQVGPAGFVLLLLDSDDACPATLGPLLLARARKARPDAAIGVVLAKREFEAWFLAAAHSLAGQRGLLPDLQPPPRPEEIRGAKEWLSQRMARPYSPPLDQPALASLFDLQQARGADSFAKLWRDVGRLIAEARRRALDVLRLDRNDS